MCPGRKSGDAVSEVKLAVKVDVDTRLGTIEGVPRLREMFVSRGVGASFFLSLGPDNSGRAIWRVFTRPGFLAKQLRTGAPSAFGWKTLLYGTLLPAPIIGRGQEELVRSLVESGQEVGLHAWDHVRWHDGLWRMAPEEARAEVQRGLEAFALTAGFRARSFAAPAWRISGPAVEALEEAGVFYMSATRGRGPYHPVLDGRRSRLLEVPTTLPTADEVLGRDGVTAENLPEFYLRRLEIPGLHVLTVHAEMEGRVLAGPFERLLDGVLKAGVELLTLREAAEDVMTRPEQVPVMPVVRSELPGRPGEVSHQG